MLLSDMRIARKLALVLTLLLAISAAIGGFSAYNIWSLARTERAIVNGDVAGLRWVASAQEHMTRVHQLVFQINATPFSASAQLRDRLSFEERGLSSDLGRLRAVISPEEEHLYLQIQAGVRRYMTMAARDIEFLKSGRQTEADALLRGVGVQAFDQVDTAFDTMVDKQARETDTAAALAALRARQALWLMVLVSLAGSAGLGGFAMTIARREISKPLGKITEALGRLAAGETTEALSASGRRDEIGDLIRVFDVFRENLVALAASREDAEEQRRLAETERLNGGFFRSAIESSMDSVRVLDLAGRLMFMNRGGQTAFEITDVAQLVGQPCKSLWPEPAAAEIEIGVAAALNGATHRFEGFCPTQGGVEKWWDVFIAPVRDDAGAVAAIVETSRDITAAYGLRVEAAARELRLAKTAAALRSASQLAQVGAWEIDFTTDQTVFSDELWALLGRPPLPAMPFAESVAGWFDEDRVAFKRALARARESGERLSFEGRTHGEEGATRSWRLFGEPVFAEGRCVAMRGASQEITSWVDMQERERAAIAAAQAMSAFLATMSHELRTPLNGVLGMAQALARSDLSPPQRDHVAVIESSGEALLSLLNDLLDLSKIEAGKIELEDGLVDADALADGARSLLASLVRDKDVAFEVSVDDLARGGWRGDPTRVRQVLHNLISNAVKFTDQGLIRVELAGNDAGLVLMVRDTGVGIAPDKLQAVFDKFVQADASTTRRYGGSGLGLTISKDLVSLMGGQISVDSTEGQGTTFTVRLPLERAPMARASSPETRPTTSSDIHEPKPLRVLAAEDNPVNQVVLRTLLSEVGIEATIVSNGQQALEAWRDGAWDLVLMDIQMPVMDGVAAVRAIRASECEQRLAKTPIIAVTANAMAHHRAEYLAAGMDAVVPKPIELRALLSTIEAVLDAADNVGAAAGHA